MTLAEKSLPKLVAFDLDATLWDPEMYELCGPPFKVDKKDPNFVLDSSGERVRLMGASRAILRELATHERWRDTVVAYVSRTEYPRWADTFLKLFQVAEGVSMYDVASEQEIYPGSKTRHFARIHHNTGIEYEDMLFFDNEYGNVIDCAPLGICSVYCPRGMTEEVWNTGLEAFVAAKEARERGEKPKLQIRTSSGW